MNKVYNMTNTKGKKITNQFIIETDDAMIFQSYNSVICKRVFKDKKVYLDSFYHDYSKTTIKYRNLFLNEDSKTIERKIKEGIYTLTNLNK